MPENKNDKKTDKTAINAVETRFILAKKLIANLKDELDNLENLLVSDAESADFEEVMRKRASISNETIAPARDGRIVEGVFDGEQMIGSDGKRYLVPQNYASKSKLVEGDILKLTIQPNGGFLFKQIGPIERERIVGLLMEDENTQEWRVIAEGKKYSILPASVSYFKGQSGDNVVVLIPKSAPSKWAAVENVIKQG
ncbi:MAG: hypothetical protein ABH820_00605 [Patescibacteria group bacterium]|nr:hypothetical protein [Patescibacteria group bacterium]MBU2508773.1 hypothetical protein [Patescibacteria group bacterium]